MNEIIGHRTKEQCLLLVEEFNRRMSTSAELFIKTNFGDDLYDEYEWCFYRLDPISSSEEQEGTRACRLAGFYREGKSLFQGEKGGFTAPSPTERSFERIYAISPSHAKSGRSIPFRGERFHYLPGTYESVIQDLFPRYWVDQENLIEVAYPQKWQAIKSLCLPIIESLTATAKARDYRSGWIYHNYNQKNLTEHINNVILKDTCFYYSAEIFYNRFHIPYSSSKEKREQEEKFWREQDDRLSW